MEAVAVPHSPEQPVSHNKQTQYASRKFRPFSSKQTEILAPYHIHGGFFSTPQTCLSLYFPPSISFYDQQTLQIQTQKQPPLLPLPVTKSKPHLARGISCPPRTTEKVSKPRRQSLSSRTSEQTKKNKKTSADAKPLVRAVSECLIITSGQGQEENNGLFDDACGDSISASAGKDFGSVKEGESLKYSSTPLYILSPPPSSLPLPKFFLGRKLDCAGVDAGATDTLPQILCPP